MNCVTRFDVVLKLKFGCLFLPQNLKSYTTAGMNSIARENLTKFRCTFLKRFKMQIRKFLILKRGGASRFVKITTYFMFIFFDKMPKI